MKQTISVVLCTYNGSRYLREQLDSILGQTCQPLEIIIQDDHSSDDTWAIVTEYAAKHAFIKVYRNKVNIGVNANFFAAMHRTIGDYIAISDQDDIWKPEKLEFQQKAIAGKMLCSAFSKPFSSDGFPVSWDSRLPNYHLLRVLYLGVLPGHTLFFDRRLLSYLPEGDKCPYFYDWQLQVVAAAAESIVFLPETLVNWRRHTEAVTATAPTTKALGGGVRYFLTTLLHHGTLQKYIRIRFQYIDGMLARLPFCTESLQKGREMASLQCRHLDFWKWFRFTVFCVKNRKYLFHSRGSHPCLLVLRALYYPFSCGWYYRGVLRTKNDF